MGYTDNITVQGWLWYSSENPLRRNKHMHDWKHLGKKNQAIFIVAFVMQLF